MTVLPLAGAGASILLAGVFIFAGASKLRARTAFEGTLRQLRLPVRPLLIGVPTAELVLGVGLISPFSAAAAWAAAALLALFAVVALLPRSTPVSCACFGSQSTTPLGLGTALRNAALIGVCILAACAAPNGLWAVLGHAGAEHLLLTGLGVAAAGIICWQSLQLASVRRRLDDELALLRDGQLRLGRALSGDAPEQRPIPAVEVMRSDGSWIDLAAVAQTRPQLVLFTRESCPACRLFAELVPGWRARAEPVAELTIAYVGSPAAARREWPDDAAVILESTPPAVLQALGVVTYPAVVLFGTNGMVATAPLQTQQLVEELIDELHAVSRPREN